jgi:hypothetical protein
MLANVTKTELLVTTLILAGALFLAALVIKLVDRWRKQQDDDVLSPEDQLAHFQRLHWKGELSKEEFERIQALLAERIRQEQVRQELAAPAEGKPQPPEPPETGIRTEPPD